MDSIAGVFPQSKRKEVSKVAAAIVPTLAEAIPAVIDALPEVTHVVKSIVPVIRDVKTLFNFSQK